MSLILESEPVGSVIISGNTRCKRTQTQTHTHTHTRSRCSRHNQGSEWCMKRLCTVLTTSKNRSVVNVFRHFPILCLCNNDTRTHTNSHETNAAAGRGGGCAVAAHTGTHRQSSSAPKLVSASSRGRHVARGFVSRPLGAPQHEERTGACPPKMLAAARGVGVAWRVGVVLRRIWNLV